uniref:Oocyst wall protein n=1 Tax=Chromera velia CCMP2878 TaxID=1169474 RepID=A0A0G4IBB6_9ALVE|eukprot:Cvel_12793.t1-p1 / transcript=Cvel_12793.t1 / gene=Cvel_12793 / organism=Chromera_velia_CCMP2878 / gene_product=Flocculation protein FLO11, putative / transcript_product=Flocculation protein FLO11, putative / location=Cvel_scaffold851:58890-61996(+) / protein_length=909 / sequence_SO=supercontig / SO=protein_coding / is_pseudo=false
MKFLLIPAAFALAAANKAAPTYQKGAPTYTCPKGYELAGTDCVKTVTAPYEQNTVPHTTSVAPEVYCPKGSTLSGADCVSTVSVKKVPKVIHTKTPVSVCPKGSEGPGKDGLCTIQKTAQQAVVVENKVADQSTQVARSPYEVPVEKPVSVPGAPVCPKGTQDDKKGNCIVTGSTEDYFLTDVTSSVSVPKNIASSYQVCPDVDTGLGHGKHDDDDDSHRHSRRSRRDRHAKKAEECYATTSFQEVQESTVMKTVRTPVLASKDASFTLPSTVMKQSSTCPEGTVANKDGTCTISLQESHLESYTVPVDSESPVLQDYPQTLTLTNTRLVPEYCCPPGSSAEGGSMKGGYAEESKHGHGHGHGHKSGKTGCVGPTASSPDELVCTVVLPFGAPVVTSTPKTISVARFEKKPKTVSVNRVESVPVEYCPKGTTEDANGNCVVTVTVQSPVPITETHTECPPGSEFTTGGSKAPKCKKPTIVSVPATQLPGDMKSKVPKYACPEGTTPIGEGPSTTCATQTWEEAPPETFTTTRITYEPSTITETVPKLYRYETRNVVDTFTTEEVVTVYDEVVVEETTASVDTVSTSNVETVPAIAQYSVITDSETVTVAGSRVAYAPCIRPDGSVASSYSGHGHGHGHKDDDKHGHGDKYSPAPITKDGGQQCLVETKYRVVTTPRIETVPMVPTYYTESIAEVRTVSETYQTYQTSEMAERSYSVGTQYSTETLPYNTIVSYHTTYESVPVTTQQISSKPAPMSETVTAIPTYTTITETEISTSEKVEAVPTCPKGSTPDKKGGCYLTTTSLSHQPTMITEAVPAERTYVEESSTIFECPPGTVDNGKSCDSTSVVPASSACPEGSTADKKGGCTTVTYTTTKVCPKGFTDNGKQCISSETVPATANYPMPAPTKKGY